MNVAEQTRKQGGPPLNSKKEVVLSARNITVAFGGNVVLDDLSLDIYRGEILGFVGASGAGKSVLLRTILGLNRKQSGRIDMFGIDVDKASELEGVYAWGWARNIWADTLG